MKPSTLLSQGEQQHIAALSASSKPKPRSHHFLLLPSWVAYYAGSPKTQLLYTSLITEYLKELADLGVYCLVLDWDNRHFAKPEKHKKLTREIRYRRLNQHPHFQIDQLNHKTFARAANWQHLVSMGEMHFRRHSPHGVVPLHIHDAAQYLSYAQYDMGRGHLVDKPLLPEKADCPGTNPGVCAPPDAQTFEVMLDYLKMVLEYATADKHQYQAQLVARRQEDYRYRQQLAKPEVVHVGCWPFGRKQKLVYKNGYEPLYPEELAQERAQRKQQQLAKKPNKSAKQHVHQAIASPGKDEAKELEIQPQRRQARLRLVSTLAEPAKEAKELPDPFADFAASARRFHFQGG